MATDAEVLAAAEVFSEASHKLDELRGVRKRTKDSLDSIDARILEAKSQRDAASATLKTLAAEL